jgi:hypothetical protein
LNQSFHQTGEQETIMKRSSDSNSLYGAQATKRVRLGESSEDEVIFAGITSTSSYSESEDNGSMTLQNTDGRITHLPNELLECILLKLSYDEISKVRQVCRRFLEVGNDILNRQFRKLKSCVESELDAVVKEENVLLWYTMQSVSGSTGRAEYNSTDPKTPTQIYELQQRLISCRRLLNSVCNQIRLLRAVSYRLFFLSDLPPNIRYSRAFFAGKIIDEVHLILRLVRMRQIESEHTYVVEFRDLAHKWILFFLHSIEPPLIQHICASNQSASPDLFGSKVIDLLECFLNCKKDISVNIDSEGWCYVKGEYKLRRSFFTCESDRNSGLETLTINEQVCLHEALYVLAMMSNQYYLVEADADENNALNANGITWLISGSYQGLSECDEFCYYYGHYSKHSYSKRFQKCNEVDEGTNRTMNNVQNLNNRINIPSSETSRFYDEEDFDLIFKVDMKCRKELAPIELLTESSYEENEDESEASIYRVHDCSPDLRLKLEIECRKAARVIRPPAVYKCLIQQIHTQQGPPVGTSEEDVIVSPICSDRRAYVFSRTR